MKNKIFIGVVLIGALALFLFSQFSRAEWWGQEEVNYQVVMNGEPLPEDQILGLQSLYGVQVVPGYYWYDNLSGLWGMEGGPSVGQMMPGLSLGGSLQSNASGANGLTQIYFNGREIHPTEQMYLQQMFGVTIPGRYWIDSQGVGGLEGGQALFNIGAMIANSQYGNTAGIGVGHSVTGSVISGDGITGYIGPDGTGVTCGPDGGCVY